MKPHAKDTRIAKYLVIKGLLTEEQAKEILKEQSKDPLRARFGRIAVQKGYITEKALNTAMMEKYQSEGDKEDKKDKKYKFLI